MTLHKAVEELKVFFKAGAAIILLCVLLFFVVRTAINIKEYFSPTPKPPPTVTFGKLPKIIFPPSVTNKKFTYIVDTLSGTLPQFSDRIAVYPVALFPQNLLALKRAGEQASNIGFRNTPIALSDSLYKWETQDEQTLLLDILTYNFSYFFSPQKKETIYASSALQNKAIAIKQAESFILNIRQFPDIDMNKTKTTTFTYDNGRLLPATSVVATNIIRVDYFQKDIGDLPIYYNNPNFSTIYAIVAEENNSPIITDAAFSYLPLQSLSATYPIKSTETALEELKKGDGYIAAYEGGKNEIAIKNAQLGYFASDKKQEFIMPIFVFEGKDGFFAYVSATDNAWIK